MTHPHLVQIGGAIPLGRASAEQLREQARVASAHPVVRALLDAIDCGVMVLNENRQIVAARLRNIPAAPEEIAHSALGRRPGEALNCRYASEGNGGCGAAEACRGCGSLNSILACQRARQPFESECLLSVAGTDSTSLELRVRASPLEIDGAQYTLLVVRDISHEKRRRALEQVFFHDVSNTLTSLSLWTRRLLTAPDERKREAAERVVSLVQRVESEVRDQRALLHAEEGTLELEPHTLDTLDVLRGVMDAFAEHPLARGRTLRLGPSQSLPLETDRSLLVRVIANMVTNALEATPRGGAVTLRCEAAGTPWACSFHVHNEGVIPLAVATRVFQRSFTTKGNRGRGLGTYGMKLLGERYLRGEVSFVSRDGEGTVFTLRMPPSPGRRASAAQDAGSRA